MQRRLRAARRERQKLEKRKEERRAKLTARAKKALKDIIMLINRIRDQMENRSDQQRSPPPDKAGGTGGVLLNCPLVASPAGLSRSSPTRPR